MWKKTEGDDMQPQFSSPPQPAVAPQRNPAPKTHGRALIGQTIFIKGDLMGEEDLLIEGRVEGKIEFRQNNISVGKNGRVKADIYGKLISIEGEVHGNLNGEEQLILRQSSNVRGNIIAPRVTLEDGCHFKGSIDMCPKEESKPSQASESDALIYKPAKLEKPGEPPKAAVLGLETSGVSRK